MGLFDQFPYTNFHELNLDWILNQMKNVEGYVKNIEGVIGETTREMIESLYEKGLLTTPYNILSNGADNTGVKDASTIIQTVLDTFKICYIPNGTYKLEKPIVVDSGMLIIGESATDAILKCVNNDAFVTRDFDDRTGKGNAEAPHGFCIMNLHMTGNDMHTGVKIYGYHYFISQCFIEHFETGIYSEYNQSLGFSPSGDTIESYIDKCLIQHCAELCIDMTGPSDCFIINTCFSNAGNGIKTSITDTSWANGCNIINCHGYTVGRDTVGACYDLHAPTNLTDCTGESAGDGVIIAYSSTNVKDCYFYNNWRYGIKIATTSNVIIDGTILRKNKTGEINLVNDLRDSYVDCVSIGDVVKMIGGSGAVDSLTTTFKIYNNLNVNIINKPKVIPKVNVDVSTLAIGTVIVPSERYGVIVYQKGGAGIYVNEGAGAGAIGDVETFFVPAGGNWSCSTVPTSVTYQPILF